MRALLGAGLALASLSLTVSSARAATGCNGYITLDPSSASAGRTVAVSASSWAPDEQLTVQMAGRTLGQAVTSAAGSAYFSFTVPPLAPAYYVVTAQQPSGGYNRDEFQVTPPPPPAPATSPRPAPRPQPAASGPHAQAAPHTQTATGPLASAAWQTAPAPGLSPAPAAVASSHVPLGRAIAASAAERAQASFPAAPAAPEATASASRSAGSALPAGAAWALALALLALAAGAALHVVARPAGDAGVGTASPLRRFFRVGLPP